MNAPTDRAVTLDQTGADQLSDAVISGLTALIRAQTPQARDIRLERLVRSAGGLSRENWRLDASWTDARGTHSHELMLMRDASGTLLETERDREFAVLSALAHSDVPTPRAHWADPDGRYLGAPSIVMDRMPGQCDYLVLNGSAPIEARLALAQRFLEVLTRIHAFDWRAAGLGASLGEPQDKPSSVELAHWTRVYQRVRLEPHPELDYIHAWLSAREPEAEAVVLVHGDFKPGNALVEDGRITAKLDWETAHLGDPLEDLGWITNPVRRREHQIADHWEREQIVTGYRALTGRMVNEHHLTWWNVFSNWKLAVIQLTAIAEFVAGRYDRVFQTPSWLYRPMFQMMERAS